MTDGLEIGVTEHGYVTLLASKDGTQVAFALDPSDADRVVRELQSKRAEAVSLRNDPDTPDR